MHHSTAGPRSASVSASELQRHSHAHRIRCWRPTDQRAVGELWAEALLASGVTSFGKGYASQQTEQLRVQVLDQLQRAAQRKQEATQQARQLRSVLAQHPGAVDTAAPAVPAKRRGASQTGQHTDAAKALAGTRQELQKLRRKRMWACLVAESPEHQQTSPSASASSQQLLGYILLRISQPLALLPPPFPSASPYLLHIDALAVCQSARRKGVATALLDRAETLARRWGRRSLFLEVDTRNTAAQQLYLARGYRVVRMLTWPFRQSRKLILCKDLKPSTAQQAAAASAVRTAANIESQSNGSTEQEGAKQFQGKERVESEQSRVATSNKKAGVFVWDQDST